MQKWFGFLGSSEVYLHVLKWMCLSSFFLWSRMESVSVLDLSSHFIQGAKTQMVSLGLALTS